MRPPTILALPLAGALVLGACTGGDDGHGVGLGPADTVIPAAADATAASDDAAPDDVSPGGDAEHNEGDGRTDADDGGLGGDEHDDLSILGRYLGYEIPGFGGDDDLALRRLEQDTIAACMRREGFEYVAWVEDPAVVYVPVEEGLDPTSREFATRYGFGVSTQFYGQRDVGPGLVGHSGDGSGVNVTENPNSAIRADLTPRELEAYDRAFWGDDSPVFGGEVDEPADGDEAGVLAARQMVANGCIGEAQRAIDGEAGAVLDAFAPEILGMPTRAYADPRYRAHADDVERCVRAAGFDFYSVEPPWATLAHFDDLLFQLDESVGGDPFDELDEADLAELTPRELDALHDVPRTLSNEVKTRLGEIQDLEIRTATAVWDCGGNAETERALIDEILGELQTEFIDANREELARFRR